MESVADRIVSRLFADDVRGRVVMRLVQDIGGQTSGGYCPDAVRKIIAEELAKEQTRDEPGMADGYTQLIQRHIREIEAWKARAALAESEAAHE